VLELRTQKGQALMERSAATFFTALAYRNLAIDWNAEADPAKTDHYVHQALDWEPNDLQPGVRRGIHGRKPHGDEALKIAREREYAARFLRSGGNLRTARSN
jgi:hypothetical protein